ncbi:protein DETOXIFICATION 14-like isoform X1 [Coffea arabica]|uniref:Protein DETOXIFICATION 14-like isoform X1 n=1 Tax=Coffea arabica TaxID=13443 RepID=A0A6P6T6Q6_COFAR|nr:protein DETOXIFICATION 14-like isoform X1 [Coffea arabica]XP_027074059.1 protein DETOXIFICATION 14-like isoform X1 [Coffea arabica]
MEEPLPGDMVQRKRVVPRRDLFVQELKMFSSIALPLVVVVTASQHFSRIASMIMAGHFGEDSFSGTSIATYLTDVTGFTLLFGMASALESLCGQACGAGLYHKLGMNTYGAIISLIMVCIPISLLWLLLDKLLIFTGQNHLISAEAGGYAFWLIPALFPYAVLQALIRYLQTQNLILPLVLSSVAALCFHLPVCWAFVFYLKLGNTGAALALGLSYWFNVILLVLYVKYSAACEKTRISFSTDAFLSMGEFIKVAIPSAVTVW